jgi:Protein of unknown function (DUF499)
VDHYRGKPAVTHALYTDAKQFFGGATYATEGLRMVLTDVFSRLAGKHSAPTLHRLETALGGGKTHTLIALTHLGFRGRELAAVTQGIIEPQLLYAPGEVTVVGIAGDELPVHQPQRSDLAPYTIWGELAYQIGGEALYRQVETAATSPAAPDRRFFERILEGRKVVIMLDELAQYAARLEAARPHRSEQLAAFLLALHGYAQPMPGLPSCSPSPARAMPSPAKPVAWSSSSPQCAARTWPRTRSLAWRSKPRAVSAASWLATR